jgi:hypothetical protein
MTPGFGSNPDSLLVAALVLAGAGFAAAAAAVLADSAAKVKVSVLLPLGAALMKAPASAGECTRALVPVCVRVGRPVGSAFAESGRPSRPARMGTEATRVAEASINHPAVGRVGR